MHFKCCCGPNSEEIPLEEIRAGSSKLALRPIAKKFVAFFAQRTVRAGS